MSLSLPFWACRMCIILSPPHFSTVSPYKDSIPLFHPLLRFLGLTRIWLDLPVGYLPTSFMSSLFLSAALTFSSTSPHFITADSSPSPSTLYLCSSSLSPHFTATSSLRQMIGCEGLVAMGIDGNGGLTVVYLVWSAPSLIAFPVLTIFYSLSHFTSQSQTAAETN